jgi:glycine amidinotransferase|tara:strand:- start:231 stop:1208 length:978 start_codon:yes stop_codon:yes gene_type:complete
MFKVYDEFTQLKQVVLGDVNMNLLDHVDRHEKLFITEIFEETKENLNTIAKIYESHGVKVNRPVIHESFSQNIVMPFNNTQGIRNPLSPRDTFIMLGSTMLETAGYRADMLFEYMYYKNLFTSNWNNNKHRWIKMPSPMYAEELSNEEPIIDAAQIMRMGDHIIVSENGAVNNLGIKWLEQHFDEFTIIRCGEHIQGHVDGQIKILKPGLIITPHPKNHLPDCFQSWNIITPSDVLTGEPITNGILFRDDDVENTFPSCAIMSLNEHTVFLYEHFKHSHKQFVDKLESHGIDIIFVPFKHQHWFNQGLTCLTLELDRAGDKQNYI